MNSIITTTDDDFQTYLNKHQKVMVKYYAGWCGSCRLMTPKYTQLTSNELYKDVFFLKVDAEHNPNCRKAAGVNNLPFFATFLDGQLQEGKSTSKIDVVEQMLENII